MQIDERVDNGLQAIFEDIDLDMACEGCRFYSKWFESHPYGEGIATEELAECNANRWIECKRMQQALDELQRQGD